MARGMTSASLALVVLMLPLLAQAVDVPVFTFDDLVAAVTQANKNGQACNNTQGCLGEVVRAVLYNKVDITAPLPGVTANAHLVVTGGNCTGNNGKCVIDGLGESQIFPSGAISPFGGTVPGQLELYSLIFERAKGGVLYNTFCIVIAKNCIFRNNIEGVVKNMGFFGGAPSQTFTDCGFFNNKGTPIDAGNGKLGLALDGGLAFTFTRCVFGKNVGNTGSPMDIFTLSGGAVSLAGSGTSMFDHVIFAENEAQSGGGAVFVDQSNVIFRAVTFNDNTALGGGGGAVLGQNGFYRNTSVSFCSTYFTANSAPKQPEAANLLFRTYTFPTPYGRVDVHFCDTAVPAGSVFTKEPNGGFTTGIGQDTRLCASQFCIA